MRFYLVVIELEAENDERIQSIAEALVSQVDGELVTVRALPETP